MRSTKLSFLFIIEGVFGVVVAFYAPAWGALLAEIGVFQCSVADFVCLREQSIVVLGAFVALFITIDCSVLLVLRYRMNKQLAQSAKGEWIQLYYDNSDKRCHHFQGPANVGEGNRYFTRIQVTNRSNAIVDRCSGRLVSILDDKHREVDNWVDSRLYWDGEVFEVSLSPNESRFLNVV